MPQLRGAPQFPGTIALMKKYTSCWLAFLLASASIGMPLIAVLTIAAVAFEVSQLVEILFGTALAAVIPLFSFRLLLRRPLRAGGCHSFSVRLIP